MKVIPAEKYVPFRPVEFTVTLQTPAELEAFYCMSLREEVIPASMSKIVDEHSGSVLEYNDSRSLHMIYSQFMTLVHNVLAERTPC